MYKWILAFPYYENPGMLKHQIAVWNSYPKEYRDMFEIIVVDDGSQESPAIQVLKDAPIINFRFRLYRIMVDVAWNQTAARNLAVYEADKDSWLFLTDIDHVLEKDEFEKLMHCDNLRVDKYYSLKRLNGPEKGHYKYHPNSFVMHRDLYTQVGGYDEEFSGKVYATDGMFRRNLNMHAKGNAELDVHIIRFGREHIPDASTRTLIRGKDFQSEEIRLQIKDRDKYKREHSIKPLVLSFPWERVL